MTGVRPHGDAAADAGVMGAEAEAQAAEGVPGSLAAQGEAEAEAAEGVAARVEAVGAGEASEMEADVFFSSWSSCTLSKAPRFSALASLAAPPGEKAGGGGGFMPSKAAGATGAGQNGACITCAPPAPGGVAGATIGAATGALTTLRAASRNSAPRARFQGSQACVNRGVCMSLWLARTSSGSTCQPASPKKPFGDTMGEKCGWSTWGYHIGEGVSGEKHIDAAAASATLALTSPWPWPRSSESGRGERRAYRGSCNVGDALAPAPAAAEAPRAAAAGEAISADVGVCF